MRTETFARLRSFFSIVVMSSAAYAFLSLFAESAHAIPVFARKYQTSCMTCHSGFPKLNGVGLAFKMNGYRFAQGDEDKVKQPPLQLGNDNYRDIFPNSILPSEIPMMPPISFEVQQTMSINMWTPNGGAATGPSPNNNFPTQINGMSAGTLTNNISYWFNGGFTSAGSPDSFNPYIERAFLVVNNMFAPDADEDENGMHLARSGLVLPKHMLNLKVGLFEPYAIAPYASQYRGLSITGRLPSTLTVGSSSFAFESPGVRGVEAYGIWRNYTSWCFGVVDGAGSSSPVAGNSTRDMYARVGHKWWGYPLDGEVVAVTKPKPKEETTMVTRGQNMDADTDLEEDDPTPWVDYYRQSQFETGIFGYLGRNAVSPLNNPFLFSSGTTGLIGADNFNRVGFDCQWQHHDLHILATYMYGQDRNAGTDPYSLNFNTWYVEANYYFKPWMIGYARYEELQFVQNGFNVNNIQRAVPGIAFYPIVNMAIRSEFVIDASGKGTTPNQLLMMADYAF